jgi:hopene-associated glycosyltransferase HpnB
LLLYEGPVAALAYLVTFESLFFTIIPLILWAGILFLRGGFWRADQRLEIRPEVSMSGEWPEVACVIPARNESQTIAKTVASLTDQNYPGKFHVIVVDDNSDDNTAVIAGSTTKHPNLLHVFKGKPLEKGWSGKLWAVHQGLEKVKHLAPGASYILLTDSDITHDNKSLFRLVRKAKIDHLVLVSLMVRLSTDSFWEKLLIPPFIFFFQKLYPFPWVNDPNKSSAAAAGGCMLVLRAALDRIGGVKPISRHLIDDCKLAALLKKEGPIWLGLSDQVISERSYKHLSEIWNMVARTAYEQLGNSLFVLIGTIATMGIIYILPPLSVAIFLVAGPVDLLIGGLTCWVMMGFAFKPTLTFYGMSQAWSLLLPLAAFLYTLMTISSAINYLQGRGNFWKGRFYKT